MEENNEGEVKAKINNFLENIYSESKDKLNQKDESNIKIEDGSTEENKNIYNQNEENKNEPLKERIKNMTKHFSSEMYLNTDPNEEERRPYKHFQVRSTDFGELFMKTQSNNYSDEKDKGLNLNEFMMTEHPQRKYRQMSNVEELQKFSDAFHFERKKNNIGISSPLIKNNKVLKFLDSLSKKNEFSSKFNQKNPKLQFTQNKIKKSYKDKGNLRNSAFTYIMEKMNLSPSRINDIKINKTSLKDKGLLKTKSFFLKERGTDTNNQISKYNDFMNEILGDTKFKLKSPPKKIQINSYNKYKYPLNYFKNYNTNFEDKKKDLIAGIRNNIINSYDSQETKIGFKGLNNTSNDFNALKSFYYNNFKGNTRNKSPDEFFINRENINQNKWKNKTEKVYPSNYLKFSKVDNY
ncbi:MAG: hypothetical protein MJ252_09245 [archaeon]|nr:hypothetical protein [archaeon]